MSQALQRWEVMIQVKTKVSSGVPFFLTELLTGRFLSHEWLALHAAIDSIDVKAIERARLQVSDVGVRVG